MKVLSIKQPWATLICNGAKKIETRSFITNFRGRVLIHASQTKPTRALQKTWKEEDPYKSLCADIMALPLGCIIGAAHLDAVHPVEDIKADRCAFLEKPLTDLELSVGDYSAGRFGWIMSKPELFTHPVQAKGELGIWGVRNARAFTYENNTIKYYGQTFVNDVSMQVSFEVCVRLCMQGTSDIYNAKMHKIEQDLFNLPF